MFDQQPGFLGKRHGRAGIIGRTVMMVIGHGVLLIRGGQDYPISIWILVRAQFGATAYITFDKSVHHFKQIVRKPGMLSVTNPRVLMDL
jgi:hypothetical protein